MNTLTLRPALDSDGPAILAIMVECFLQFPGCYFDNAENADVLAPASTYTQKGGIYVVLQNHGGQIEAVAGVKRADAEDVARWSAQWELSRFYVRPQLQGQKAGSRLLDALIKFCQQNGNGGSGSGDNSGGLVAWSDTRFIGAHAFYQHHGLVQKGAERPLYDISASQEYAFHKEI